MKILLHNSKIFIFLLLLTQTLVFGQSVGDYRSVANGNWTNPGSWQYYNGIDWVNATYSPGTIGQVTGAVLIQAGNEITIGTSGISTATMGTLTISGSLVLTGTNTGGVGTNFIFETQTIIVTPLLGTIKFIDKVNLKLPANATLQVKFDLTPNPDYYGLIGDCNHNQDIIIGSSTYAYCNGGGSTGLTFYQVMGGGGTLNSVPSSDSPICYGDTILLYGSYMGPIGNGITYTWTITDPNGASSTIIAKDASVINAIAGNYVIKLSCSTVYGSVAYSNSETILVIVNPLPSPPTVETPNQPTCEVPTGSVVLSGLPASGTWILTRSGTLSATTTGTGTSTTITGLASGTYTYTVSIGSCTSGSSSDVVINETTNTWNVVSGDGSWTNTLTNAQEITFNGNYDSTGDLTACSCTVNAGVSVNIYSGHTLTLTNKLIVDTPGFGDITFFDNASLVQINDVKNSGEIDYVRTTNTGIKNTDYVYWSSPVYSTDQTLGYLSPFTLDGMLYSYNSSIDDWNQESLSTIMLPGNGYIVRGPESVIGSGIIPGDLYTATFTGVPNNGHYEIDAIADRSYLLGNPYPSALDADTFLNDNADVLDGTLYFWTHNTALDLAGNISNPGPGWAYTYSLDDYAVYNLTGGVQIEGVTYEKGGTIAPSGGEKPTGKIASGQGFFASSKLGIPSNSKIIYDNTMRVGVIDIAEEDNSQFFKTKNPNKSAKTIEKNRIWLNLTNTQGAFKQTLIGYVTDATNDYDNRFDGESYDGNEFVDFYSVNQDKNLVIQGRALPFDENDEVPLGYRTTINGAFTVNIDQVDGLLTNQSVYLEDKLTNTVTDLKSGNYTFNTVAGTFDDRFVLRYIDNSTSKTLGTNTFDSLEKTVLVSNKNKQIKIDSSVEMIDKVTVFDILGRQIYQKTNVNSHELLIANLLSNRQVVIVKTLLQNGQEVSNKIVY